MASATLVAVTVTVPAVAGALNSPVELTAPDEAFQITEVLVAVPWTVAVSCTVPLVATAAEAGETVTEDTEGPGAEDVAVALSGTMTGFALALVKMARLPVALPAVVAAKATTKL